MAGESCCAIPRESDREIIWLRSGSASSQSVSKPGNRHEIAQPAVLGLSFIVVGPAFAEIKQVSLF
jgi:hypothetical protein